ncbi:MAG: hypothetical protein LBM98_00495 [Oscillospiraceae bacterium]|nr:hypothetical protein [Oscillospiraceae bacterium]
MRYVGRIGARQSSAGSVTYVSADCGTGLLRACNVLRIAGVPALRNDGAPCGAPRAGHTPCSHSGAVRRSGYPAHCAGRAGLKPAPT